MLVDQETGKNVEIKLFVTLSVGFAVILQHTMMLVVFTKPVRKSVQIQINTIKFQKENIRINCSTVHFPKKKTNQFNMKNQSLMKLEITYLLVSLEPGLNLKIGSIENSK